MPAKGVQVESSATSSRVTEGAVSEADDVSLGVGRRRFLMYMVSAPTLTVGARFGLRALSPTVAAASPGVADLVDLTDVIVLAAAPTVHNLVIQITTDNHVEVDLPRAEVGQGITTTMAMLVAEELDARLIDVDMQLQDATPANVMNQLTGGSSSVSVLYQPIREVSAAIRARLVTAAAQRWGAPADTLTTRDTMVIAPDGRTATYASLAAAAANVLVPAVSQAPKSPPEFQVIGRAVTGIDARDIVTGRQRYTLDLDVPGAKPTVVARPPTIRGTVRSFDDVAARAMPGVLAIARISTGVAVVAETFDHAFKARDALQIEWNPGPLANLSDAEVFAGLRAAAPPFVVPALPPFQTVSGEFDFAFVNHAPLEPLVAIADVRPSRAEVWCSAKMPIVAQSEVAAAVGLPAAAVTLHVVRSGGSFGRRLFHDAPVEAARISKAVGMPVKLLYSRADDMHHGRMRPASHHKVRATMLLGSVTSYEHRAATTPMDLRHGFGEALTAAGAKILPGGYSQTVFHLSQNLPYSFGAATYLLGETALDVPTSSWRSVYSGTTAVADEIMVDEIARRVRRDPVAFRLAKLSGARERAVVQKVAAEGEWGRPMPSGHAQGVAIHQEYKSCAAYLVEIDATDRTAPRVTKAVVAADVGRCINPLGLEAQLIGCAMDGISVTLQAGNHLDRGAIRESSYSDFRWARMRHSPPQVEVHVMPPTGEPGGAGELGYPAAAAAVANAYARATGLSPRRFPIAG
jgi:isoquinoline 1-oxidoreductase subunit beta